MNECETKVAQGFESVLNELPILHEILATSKASPAQATERRSNRAAGTTGQYFDG